MIKEFPQKGCRHKPSKMAAEAKFGMDLAPDNMGIPASGLGPMQMDRLPRTTAPGSMVCVERPAAEGR
jgi:hypothetical protein